MLSDNKEVHVRSFKKIAIALIIICAISSIACTADDKTLIGKIYAEHPKANILDTVERQYYHAYLICTDENEVRMMMIYDSTILGIPSADLYKDHDIKVLNIVCGKELDELRRLAEIGRKSEKVPDIAK